jgi:surface polysaccharide O-acyltransferase-like enzyme
MTTVSFKSDLGPRRYDLDWVRIGAFMLLIFYHVGMYYVTWDFHVKSPHASSTIEPLMMLTSPWRLSLLFLVSGVATAYLLARGGGNFMRSRSARLLIPLVFGMLIIVPPQSYLEVVEKVGYQGSFAQFYRLYITGFHGFCREDCLVMPTWNHLWFVAYLWVYSLVLFTLVWLAPRIIAYLRDRAENNLSGLGVLMWPIVFLAAARIALVARFPQNHALVGDWYNHATYFFVFLLGFALAGTRGPWEALQRFRWHTLGAAILGWSLLCAYFGTYAADTAVPPDALRLIMRAVYGAEQWLAIAAVLGFARRHLMFDSAARRYLTAAIFPVYILHQTVIIVLAHALQPANMAPPVEGLLLVMTTAAACFLTYDLIRRVRILRPLFGVGREATVPRSAGAADGLRAAAGSF